MKRLLALSLGIAACVASFAQPAGAATEVGNKCAATTSTDGGVLISTANAPGNPLPAVIPSAGVITRWSFSVAFPVPPEVNLSETLKIFRPTATPKEVQVVGESAPQAISGGTQTFATRISVQAGDRIGALAAVSGSTGTVFCTTSNAGDVVGVVLGTAPIGSTSPILAEESGFQNPITVLIEPDADNDGYGDETQDACPQSATTQVACPVVTLSASASATKKSVTVLLTGTAAANVTVNGKVSLGKGKKATLKGGTKAVGPGAFTKFKLKFPAKLIKRLKELPPSKKLTLKVTSTAPNLAAAPTTKTIKVKLKGQGR
jgi:hypothetical protein